MEGNSMTILSRTAQLIRDLREMRVITDEDQYSYVSKGEGKIKLTINIRTRIAGAHEEALYTILDAIVTEFSKEIIRNDVFNFGMIQVILKEL